MRAEMLQREHAPQSRLNLASHLEEFLGHSFLVAHVSLAALLAPPFEKSAARCHLDGGRLAPHPRALSVVGRAGLGEGKGWGGGGGG